MVAVPSIGRATEITPRRRAPEAEATRDLYERYARQIHAYCLHQLGSREEAEDAVQSTFLNAFRGLKRGVDPEFESAWLYKIAENVCLTRQRSSYRRRRIESPGDLDAMQDALPSHEPDNDQLIGLPAALEGMPEQQRRALLLREWQGLSYREIAGELGLSQSAVETLLFRARRSLANALTDEFGAKKTGVGKLRAGGDAGSLVALVKTIVFSGGAKVAATVVAVAATSAVAATPAVRHSAESAFAPLHAPRTKAAVARHLRQATPVHASLAALRATRTRPQNGNRVAVASRAASASHVSHLHLVPALAPTPPVLAAPSPRHTTDDPVAAAPPPVVDVPTAPAADSVPTPAISAPADTGSGVASLPPTPTPTTPTPTTPMPTTVKDPGKGPQTDTPAVVVTPFTVQVDVKAARKAAKADERAARDHGKKGDAPAPTPPTAPEPATSAPTSPAPAPTTLPPVTIAPSPADAQPVTLVAPAVAPAAPAPPVVAPIPPVPPVTVAPVMPAAGGTDHGVRNGHRK